MSAKYCLECGSTLREGPSGNRRITLGDYELAEYDNDPDLVERPDPDPEAPIVDRDALVSLALVPARPSGPFVSAILITLLALIVSLSYVGVNALGRLRQGQEAELIRQVQLEKEAELAAQRAAYLKIQREFIILAQAQAGAYRTNLEELDRIEGSRWLTNVFLGGIFTGMQDRFRASDSYNGLLARSEALRDTIKKLAGPPAGLEALYPLARALERADQALTDRFRGELDETAGADLADLLADFEAALEAASAAEGNPQ